MGHAIILVLTVLPIERPIPFDQHCIDNGALFVLRQPVNSSRLVPALCYNCFGRNGKYPMALIYLASLSCGLSRNTLTSWLWIINICCRVFFCLTHAIDILLRLLHLIKFKSCVDCAISRNLNNFTSVLDLP